VTHPLPRLVLLALLAAGAAHAQSSVERPVALSVAEDAQGALGLETAEGARLYADGRAAALAFRLGEARGHFARLGALEPAAPAGAYGLESVALWEALLTERDSHYDRFYALNDSLQAFADGLGTPAGRLAGATAKLHRALAMGRQERYARAGLAFKDACGRFRDLTDRPDPAPDALFGQGVCEVAAGSVPRTYRWLARLFGFSGSVAGGMDRLDAAASGGGAHAVEALIALAVTDVTLNERRAGTVDRVAAVARARPGSPLLAYFEGYLLLLDRRPVEAEAALRRAADALAEPGTADLPFVASHLGTALFRQDRFEEAAPLLEGYARSFRGEALVAQALLRAGIAYEMTGDRRRAEALYRRVRANRDYDTDLAAEREARRRLDAPMTDAERALVLGETAFDAGRYDDAVRTLQPVVTDGALPASQRAEAAYRTGRAYQALGDAPQALRHFRLAIDRPGDPLAKWGPWSVYHAAEVHEAAGDAAEARRLYERVLEDEGEFDYHKTLEQRARAALERLAR
jgi:tetratricopeptide (TPR) repeat protein